jgi:hypothetical protein
MHTGQATVIEPITASTRDRDASLAAFAAHYLDVISIGGGHINAMPRLSKSAAGRR